VESLSAYARQFLGQMDKPDVDHIEGLSPAVSIDQKGTSHNPRSTVGTVTEIYDYLRLLFARAGIPHCPVCGREVVRQSAQEIVDAMRTSAGTYIFCWRRWCGARARTCGVRGDRKAGSCPRMGPCTRGRGDRPDRYRSTTSMPW
jgi:hypothetical protein